MKKALSLLLVLVMVLALCACGTDAPKGTVGNAADETTAAPESTGHIHMFSDATCLEPATCSCGETEGEVLGHLFEAATCLTPMTCSVCNITEGDPLGHTYTYATCIEPATCELCGETEGDLADHNFVGGSCVTCGEPDGFYDNDSDYFDYDEDLDDPFAE